MSGPSADTTKVPHTLLLADDSVTIRRVIELTFADEDVQVVTVSDGEQAIAVMDQSPPDIVLADVGMPGRDGYQVAQHIKQTPRLAHIPVVLLTGAFEPIDQEKAAAAGCDGVLAKPFEPQQVIGRVKELLAKPKHGSSAIDERGSVPPSPPSPWTVPLVDLPLAGRAVSEPEASGVDNYFDRLDQAFADVACGEPPQTVRPSAPTPVNETSDWFSSQPPPAPSVAPDRGQMSSVPPSPVSYGSPQVGFDRVGGLGPPSFAGTTSEVPQPAVPKSSFPETPTSTEPASLPPLADAFAALLAAEQSAPPPMARPSWPTPPASGAPITDELIEQVVWRVLDRLSDRIVRDTTVDIVSRIAEQLVREEIERIKSSIK